MSEKTFIEKLLEMQKKINKGIKVYMYNETNPNRAAEMADTRARLSILLEEYNKISGTYALPKINDYRRENDDNEGIDSGSIGSDDLGFDAF